MYRKNKQALLVEGEGGGADLLTSDLAGGVLPIVVRWVKLRSGKIKKPCSGETRQVGYAATINVTVLALH